MKLQMLKRALIAYVASSLKAIWSVVAHPLTIIGKKNCDVADYRIHGNSVQNGESTPDNPVEVQSVGDYDDATEKYKVPITVRGSNLFKYISGGLDYGTIIEQLPNGAIVKGNLNTNSVYVYSRGWFLPGRRSSTATCPLLKIGDIVTISADITLLEIIAKDAHGIGFTLMSRDGNTTHSEATKTLNIGETVRLRWTIKNTKKEAIYYPIFKLNSNVLRIENIQIEYGDTATPYEPYIEPQTVNIYLDEPLGTGQVIQMSKDNLPTLPQFKGTTVYEAQTEIPPSGIQVQYF